MVMTSTEFYEKVGEILGTGHQTLKRPPHWRRTRWNNREAGNGRYPGHGLVRYFAPDYIAIIFHADGISGRYHSPEQAITAIANYVATLNDGRGHP